MPLVVALCAAGCLVTSHRIEPHPATEAPPPLVPPPTAGAQNWNHPEPVGSETAFPFLPGEDRNVSRSVGSVTRGFLVEGERVEQPHPSLLFLPTQFRRGLLYTSDPMRRILRAVSTFVAEKHPSAIVQLGNLGHRTGGDIPYSVSHNSGRDADLAFFLTGPDGAMHIPADLVEVDASGEATVTVDGQERTLVFDVARNWALVEGLIRNAGDRLQHIFVSRPLKRQLLTYGRHHGAPADVLRRAQAILGQPWGSLPHNDHFHVRIYCSATDVASGCTDQGVEHPWYDPHYEARAETVRRARRIAADKNAPADTRAAALKRLALMEADTASIAREALDDPAPVVRSAAVRSLGKAGVGARELAGRLSVEQHPQVAIELVDALGRLATDEAVDALVRELTSPRLVELPGQFDVDLRTYVADSLIETGAPEAVPALIATLDSHITGVSAASRRALRFLTNHTLGPTATSAEWETWWETHGTSPRSDWLVEGFRAAGYEVPDDVRGGIWALCKAIEDADHLSYNAQRMLMKISGESPPSLSWPKFDAHVYWSRWFEDHRQRYGLGPVPDGVATEMN
jgi:penicillin-insensitive murein endopeptidase